MIITNLETIEKRGFKKGRQRPKDRTEQKILESFERK